MFLLSFLWDTLDRDGTGHDMTTKRLMLCNKLYRRFQIHHDEYYDASTAVEGKQLKESF